MSSWAWGVTEIPAAERSIPLDTVKSELRTCGGPGGWALILSDMALVLVPQSFPKSHGPLFGKVPLATNFPLVDVASTFSSDSDSLSSESLNSLPSWRLCLHADASSLI